MSDFICEVTEVTLNDTIGDKFKVLVLVLRAQVLVLVLVLNTKVLVIEEKSLVVSLFLAFFFVAFTKSFSAKPASKHTYM